MNKTPENTFTSNNLLKTNFKLDLINKKTNNILSLVNNINIFLSTLESPKNLDDFINFKNEINKNIDSLFSTELKEKNDNFKLAFSFYDTNIFIWDDSKKSELEKLIIKKHEIYTLYLYKAIQNWLLSILLNESDLNTIMSLIDSKVFNYFNQLQLLFNANLNKWANKDYEHPSDKGLIYWGLVDWKIVAYKEILTPKNIKAKFIENIEDENLKKYFISFIKYLEDWEISFDKWLEIENYSIDSWENTNSNLSLNTPIEDYNKPNILVDLELELFLSNPDNENKDIATSLSNKYFWEDYNIWDIKFYVSESILSSWWVAFKNVLWKSFPNDKKLTDKRWTFIYSINSRLWEKNLKKCVNYIKSLWLTNIDSKSFTSLAMTEVAFHEYWHSLFIKWNSSSLLEETKASLFYFLHLYNNNLESQYDETFIRNFLIFSIIEITKKIKNKDVPDYLQYVIREKLVLEWLLKYNLIFWDKNWNIWLNSNIENFNKFLVYQKDLLLKIQDIYSDINWKETEKMLLSDLEYYVWDFIEQIYEKIIPPK